MQSKLPQSWVVKKNMIITSDGDDEEEYSEPSAKQNTLQWSRVKNPKYMLATKIQTFNIERDPEADKSINKMRVIVSNKPPMLLFDPDSFKGLEEPH